MSRLLRLGQNPEVVIVPRLFQSCHLTYKKKKKQSSLTLQKASAGECSGLSASATAPQTDAVGADARDSAAVFLHMRGRHQLEGQLGPALAPLTQKERQI